VGCGFAFLLLPGVTTGFLFLRAWGRGLSLSLFTNLSLDHLYSLAPGIYQNYRLISVVKGGRLTYSKSLPGVTLPRPLYGKKVSSSLHLGAGGFFSAT